MPTITQPGAGEFAPFYAGYVAKAGGEPIALMERQVAQFQRLGDTLTPAQAAHRYAAGKWSVKEVLGHLIDGGWLADDKHRLARQQPGESFMIGSAHHVERRGEMNIGEALKLGARLPVR